MKRLLSLLALVVFCAVVASAQVTPPKPIKSAGTLPTTCYYALNGRVDEFYKTGASAGFYTCNPSGTSWDGPYASSASGGTVTSVSVVTANGFSGSVATATTTPAITINNPTALVASTSVTSPFYASSNADVADAGAIRLGNAELIEWEASPAGTDVTLTVNSSEQFVFSAPVSALTIGAGASITSSGAGGALGALSFVTPGTGIATALAINTGSAGAPVLLNGALGTPSSGTLTSATGLPISTGLTGAGTGVLTALGVNVGSAGAFVVNGGALGTPSSGTLTSATALPVSTGISGLGTGVATALAVNVGSAGAFVAFNGALGSPSSAGTIPAFTLGGTIAGGGNQLNNIIIGTTTPLAGSFTTVSGSTSVTSPIHYGGTANGATLTIQGSSGAAPAASYVIVNPQTVAGTTPAGIFLGAATSKSLDSATVSDLIHIQGSDTHIGSIVMDTYYVNGNSIRARQAGGTSASPTKTLTNNFLLAINAQGYQETTSAFATANNASIFFKAAEDFTSTAQGVYITFQTTPTGSTTAAERLRIGADGVFTLNTVNYNTCTSLTTTAAVLGCTVSDKRLKQNFSPFNRGLEALARLSPQTYQFRPETIYFGKGEYHTGLVAQNVQRVIPEAVSDTGNGTLQIDGATMTATLVNAVNQLRVRVEMLEKENAHLRRERHQR